MEKTESTSMKNVFMLIFFILVLSTGFAVAHGTLEGFSTDKSTYHENEQLNISGIVQYNSDVPFVTIQIFTPEKSGFADFKTFPVGSDGTFSVSFHVGGPTWTTEGNYPIKVTYDGSMEKTIQYKKKSVESSSTNSKPESIANPEREPIANPERDLEKITISEDMSNFVTLKFIVPNFPALDKSPQYYIDRYNNEQNYKIWFDSQFPNESIYNILGYKNPVAVPDWVRSNAEWWAIGEINDSTFVSGIEFMLENNIIRVSNISSSGDISEEEIPPWIRNSAHWWSQDLISEDEFINSLKFLIQKGVIAVN
jgi:hypothetical protein